MLIQQQIQGIPTLPAVLFTGAEETVSLEATLPCAEEEYASALNALNDMEREVVDVSRLRRKLPRRSFLRQVSINENAAQQNGVGQAEPLTDAKFAALLNKLRDSNPAAWRERTLCAWLLGHSPLNEAQTTQSTQVLADVAQKRHASRSRRIRANMRHVVGKTLPFAAFYTLLCVAQTISWGWQYDRLASSHNSPAVLGELGLLIVPLFIGMCATLTAGLTGLMFPFLTALNAERNNQARIAAILSLGRLRSHTSVEDLCRAALDTNANVRRASEYALLLCLPALTPQHYGHVRADTTTLLCHLLNRKKERLFAHHHSTERLVLAVLDALGKVGSGDAARHVALVAQNGWTQAVRERAQAVLPVLEERRRQASDPHLLLRAAFPIREDGSQLMRPAADASPDAPELLLRASGP